MALKTFLYPLLAITAGMMYAAQSGLNAQLSRGLGTPVAASFTSFLVGVVVLAALTVALADRADLVANWRVQPWSLLLGGGLLGGAIMLSVVFLVPRIGTAAMICFLVAGQVLAALVQDQYGWFGSVIREATPGRLAGAVMVVAGAAMVRLL